MGRGPAAGKLRVLGVRRLAVVRGLTATAAVAVVALLAPGAASALTSSTYVSSSGSDSGNNCSLSTNPCADLTTALANTTSGGTVYIEGTLSLDSAVDVDQHVTFAPYPAGSAAEIEGGTTDTSGLLAIGDDTVTIQGLTFADGAHHVGLGGGAIDNSAGGTLTVSDSTFTDNYGDDGGAIDNADQSGTGSLTVSDSTFTGNQAGYDGGAIDNGDNRGNGSLTVTDSTFTNNFGGNDGGAIDNADQSGTGSLIVSDSTFASNTGGDGGAIDNGDLGGPGSVSISYSTFKGNDGEIDGGALDNADGGGQGQLAVTDSTLAGNTAGLDGETIYSSGGSVNSGTIYVAADVLDGACDQTGGTWIDDGYNAASDTSCLGGATVGTDATTSTDAGDLGALAGNGGPTQTLALDSDNPGVRLIPNGTSFTVDPTGADLTVACAVTADQRGIASPTGANCDAGAVQAVQANLYVAGSGGVYTTAPSDANACWVESSPCASLGGALSQMAAGTTVYVSGTVSASSAATTDDAVSLAANPDGTSATIEGSGDIDGLLTIGGAYAVSIQGLTFAGGVNASGLSSYGGAITNDSGGDLTISDSAFDSNDNEYGGGGAIDSADYGSNPGVGTLTIDNSSFDGNQTTEDGGAIENAYDGIGTLTIDNSTFDGNTASWGGAIDSGDDGGQGDVTVVHSTLTGNTGTDHGGTIDNADAGSGTLTVVESTLDDGTGTNGTLIDSGDDHGDGTVYIAADLLAGTCDQAAGSWNDDGYNAASDSSCLGSPGTGDATAGADAGDLGSLADNGGPTQTQQLLAGNPAINLIPDPTTLTVDDGLTSPVVSCPVTADQRGVANTGSTGCDAGAVQYATQSLMLGAGTPASAVVGQAAYTLAQSSNSGLAVSVMLDADTTNSACTLSRDVVSFAHAGACVIDANQAGNVNFTAAPQLQRSITVSPAQTSTRVTIGSAAVTATVTAVAPGGGTPTGTVLFTAAGQTIGSAKLVSGVATLAYTVPVNTTQQITASYQGSDDYDASSSAASASGATVTTTPYGTSSPPPVHNPTLTARLSSGKPKARDGWWRASVRVSFHCTTHGSPLRHGCPRPVTLDKSGRGQKLTRTITTHNGGHAKLTVSGIDIDLTRPSVRITGPRPNRSYLITAPAAHCLASERVSGLRSCRLTRRVTHTATGETTIYSARATSNAGTTRTARLTAQIRTIGFAGLAPGSDGSYRVTPGRTYTLEVLSRTKPAYVDASVAPNQPLGTHDYFTFARRADGSNLWKLTVHIEPGLGLYNRWTIGVLTGHTLHTLPVTT